MPRKIVSFTALLGFLLAACAPQATVTTIPAEPTSPPAATTAPEPTPTSEPDVVVVGALTLLSHMPLYIADSEGYFAEQNIIVEFVTADSGPELLPLLAAGNLDVLSTGIGVGLFNLMAQDDTVRIVADKGYIDPNLCTPNAILGRSDLVASGAINDAEQIKQLLIMADPVGINGYILSRWLQDTYGLSIDEFNVERLPRPAQVDAFNNGSAAIALNGEPFVTLIMDQADVEIIGKWDPYVEDMTYAAIVYGGRLRVENPELGERFMIAYLKGVEKFMEGATPENIERIAEVTGLETDLISRVCFPPVRIGGEVGYEAAIEYMQWELDAGRLDALLSEEDYWDRRFVDFANSQSD